MVLRVQGLRVEMDGTPVLRGCSFEVAEAEILAVAGESGSGKTTLARALLGLLPPTARVEGTIETGPGLPRWRGRFAGWIPQEPSAALNPRLTAGAHLAECLRASGSGRDGAQLLTEVGLDPGRAREYPQRWSGGMQQRLLIAMALAPAPALLIADEPTSALDPQTQAGVLEVLAGLRSRRHLSVVLVTHDLAVAAEIADTVMVLQQGRVVEAGPAGRVLAHPQHSHTAALVAAQPRLAGRA